MFRERWPVIRMACDPQPLTADLKCVHNSCYVHECVNTQDSVNMNTVTQTGLEQALASKLKELLASVPWLRNWRVKRIESPRDPGFDLEATLTLPEGKAILAIE